MDNCDSSLPTTNKVPFDPGWNDPPTFTYNAQQSTPGRPRNFLNKRVAFPLSSTAANPPPNVNLPPMPVLPVSSILPPNLPTNINTNVEEVQNVEIDSEKVLLEVKEILLDILQISTELGPKADNIRKKINQMEEMWSSGKLNTQVHIKMQELAKALKEDKPKIADEIHKALMVDHVSVVGTWMPGVKQLIYNCIARSELLAIDKE